MTATPTSSRRAPARYVPPASATSARIPSLDGMRALSITAVLLGHLTGTRGFPRALTTVFEGPYLDVAHLGVRVFFVISGFLITGLLLTEEARHGAIRLGSFYVRRTLRIVPAYVAYLAVVAALGAAGVITVTGRDFAHALTYTVNYADHPSWAIGHLWSLAVEEQFYLLWPLTLVLAGRRRAVFVALLAVCVVPWIRMLAQFDDQHVGATFETAADALAMGCLLALWRDRLRAVRLLHRWWLAPVLLLASTAAGTWFYRLGMLTQDSLSGLACAAFVFWCVEHPTSPLGRLLNTRPFVLVGTVSYSLYLWQQPFLNRYSTAWPVRFPVNLLLAVACAVGSYVIIERPFLALRRRAR